MTFNPETHHRKSIRLKGYDYSRQGLYFITICTHERKCIFGKIMNEKIVLNNGGIIAKKCWLGIPNHFPNVILHEFVIMPNHIHGIIELLECQHNEIKSVGIQNIEPPPNTTKKYVGVQNIEPLQNKYQKIIPNSIGSIVRGFKTGVTKWFHENTIIKTV